MAATQYQNGGWYPVGPGGKAQQYWNGNWSDQPVTGTVNGRNYEQQPMGSLPGDKGYGGSSSNSFGGAGSDWNTVLNQNKQSLADLFNSQKQQEQDYINTLKTDVPNIQSSLESKYGLPALRTSVSNLSSTLANLPQTALDRAQRYDLSESQKQEYQAGEANKIGPALSGASSALSTQNDAYNQAITQALMPYQTEGSLLQTRLARESTGYSQQLQDELNVYMDRLHRGEQLSDTESQRANDLAIKEGDWANQLKIAQLQYGNNDASSNFQFSGGQQGVNSNDPLGIMSGGGINYTNQNDPLGLLSYTPSKSNYNNMA